MGVENFPKKEEEKISEGEINSEKIKNLWWDYSFLGEPPKAGSIAENRLKENCQNYVRAALGKRGGSSSKQREAHNNLCQMTMGKSREQLDNYTAELVGDFAFQLAYGSSMREALADY